MKDYWWPRLPRRINQKTSQYLDQINHEAQAFELAIYNLWISRDGDSPK
jgi:hypothetical protein